MTATPKETRDTSNISYFGEPVYTYTLPPLNEQKRIVVKVDMLMAYLDELEKTILGQDII